MGDSDLLKHEKDKLKFFLSQTGSILIDLGFLALWVIAHNLFDHYIMKWVHLSQNEGYVIEAFKIIFAVTTLATVSAYLISDVKRVFINAFKKGRSEIKAEKAPPALGEPKQTDSLTIKPENTFEMETRRDVVDRRNK